MGALGAQLGEGLLDSLYTPQVTDGLHVDSQGNYVDATGKPTTPYVKPGFFSRIVSPTARSINALDAESSLQPMEAQRQNTIRNLVGGGNFAKMRAANTTGAGFTDVPDDVGFMANPSMSPSGYATQGTSILNNRAGIQPLQSSADIVQAQSNLQAAKASLNRQPVVEAGLDQDAVNHLAKTLNVDTTLIQNAAAQAKREGQRISSEQDLQDYIVGLKQRQAGLESTTTDIAQKQANTALDMSPVSSDTLRKSIYAENAGATYGPIKPALSTITSANGDMSLGRNPVGLSTIDTTMANAGQPINNTTSVTSPSGRTYQVPHSIHPTVTSISDRRPTVAQTAEWQHQPQTTNVADTQNVAFKPTISSVDIQQWMDSVNAKKKRDDNYKKLVGGGIQDTSGWTPNQNY